MRNLLLATASVVALGFAATAAMAAGSTVYDSQDGNNQTLTITQSSGANDSVGAYNNPVVQNNGTGSGSNSLTITQAGSYNSFGTSKASFQSGTDNRANVEQDGYNSVVNLQQSGNNNGPIGTAGEGIIWYNDSDAGLILQTNTANSSTVDLTQSGSTNFANIGQGGYNNKVMATQIGRDMLWIRQGTNSPDVWYSPSLAVAASESNSTINVYQNGGGAQVNTNYAAIAQGGGNANQVNVTQSGYALSADVNQNGSNNVFTSSQSGHGNFVGGESGWPNADSSPILQRGLGNQYISTQSGDNAQAFGSQLGDNNFVSNFQSGNSNLISGSQTGNNNQLYSQQTGTSDTLNYTQTASANFISNVQGGTGNTVTIHQ
jgi:hypothetical protein